MLLPSCWAERDLKTCDRTQLSDKATRNYWLEHETCWKTWFNQETSRHIADSAIRTNTAHKYQLQIMVLADFKALPLVSIRSAHGWKNDTCLFLARKSPQRAEGTWADLSNPWKSAGSTFFQDLYQQVPWYLLAVAFRIWVLRNPGYINKCRFCSLDCWKHLAVYPYSMISHCLWAFHG